jgi:hypothetical protein
MTGAVLLPIHVAAGGLAILLGTVALLVKKGGAIHRRSGLLFVYAMLVMGTTASILAFLKYGRAEGNVLAGIMVTYFVGTALTTVRPVTRWTRAFNVAALTVAVGVASFDVVTGVTAFNSPGRAPDGVPFRTIAVVSSVVGTVMMLAAAGDVRLLLSGPLRGAPRLARHLWRMCFALFIAAGSFLSIRERVARILPEPLTTGPMRLLPILLLFGAMFYWLWRLRRRPLPVVIRSTPPPRSRSTAPPP